MKLDRINTDLKEAVRLNGQSRLATLRSYRISWWVHWALIAEMFLPRRYIWLVTPNRLNRGSPVNGQIIDETGLLAARTLGTGLLAGLTSPTKPWFKLGIFGQNEIDEGPVKEWLAECTNRILQVYANSNFYESQGVKFRDVVTFGSAAQIQYEDPKDVIRFYNPALGEFFFGLSNTLKVDTLYREYTYTVKQMIQEFGYENCSTSVQRMSKTASSVDTEVVVCHAIEPNDTISLSGADLGYLVPKIFPYREIYFEYSSPSGNLGGFLNRVRGFREQPFSGLRWDVTSNDPYGSGPGFDAMPAVRQLQQEQRRKGEGIDKQVRPPMVGSVALKNEPVDTLPGGVTFTSDPKADGFKPAYMVQPQLNDLREDLLEVQSRVNKIFYVDLFQLISDLKTVRTATEIDARNQEKIILLGPVIERAETEDLDLQIARTYNIMMRRGLFPPPPQELRGVRLVPQYISFLAEAQRSASTLALERLMQFSGGLVGVQPDILDNINTDNVIDHYAALLNVPPDVIRALKTVLAIRQRRQAAQQSQAALATGSVAAQGAQTLSQTDVGGGQNALQKILDQ